MNSDEIKLARWLEDELQGEELTAFEATLSDQPERFAEREAVRRWRAEVASEIPSPEEPPYPDFFSNRIARAVRETTPVSRPVAPRSFSWKSLLMPFAACAGMVLAFQIGARRNSSPGIVVEGVPKAVPVDPVLYTPERGVKAEWFASSEASATVIVLDGVAAIPDSMDFSETASIHPQNEANRTAGTNSETENESDL